MHLTLLDWSIIGAYLAISASVGIYFSRRAGRSVDDFFVANRSLPWWLAGMTMVATAMAGDLVAFTPKKVGRSVKQGRSCATIESGKWVGPAKSAAAGEVVEINDALVANPSIANSDPYEDGWMVILKPDDWDSVKPSLTVGAQVQAPYEAKMTADGFAGCA